MNDVMTPVLQWAVVDSACETIRVMNSVRYLSPPCPPLTPLRVLYWQ